MTTGRDAKRGLCDWREEITTSASILTLRLASKAGAPSASPTATATAAATATATTSAVALVALVALVPLAAAEALSCRSPAELVVLVDFVFPWGIEYPVVFLP